MFPATCQCRHGSAVKPLVHGEMGHRHCRQRIVTRFPLPSRSSLSALFQDSHGVILLLLLTRALPGESEGFGAIAGFHQAQEDEEQVWKMIKSDLWPLHTHTPIPKSHLGTSLYNGSVGGGPRVGRGEPHLPQFPGQLL